MVNVAREMERRGLDLPLLIGGATTSKQHTAVQDRARVLAADGARARRVARRRRRLGPARRRRAAAGSTTRTASCRSGCASSTRSASASRCCRSRRRARTAQRVAFDDLPTPAFTGSAYRRAAISPTLREYIDWQFFFHAWELKGKFPAILEQPAARELYDDAQELLDEIVARRRCSAPAASTASGRRTPRATTSSLDNRPANALPVPPPAVRLRRLAPEPLPRRLRRTRRGGSSGGDHVGAFAVAGPRRRRARRALRGRARRLPRDHGQGARRPPRRGVRRVPARAGAPRLVRDRAPSCRARTLIAERYRGIRPAFGYPACPDHSEKRKLFDLLARRGGGCRAHRDVRDAAGRERQRPLPRPSRGALLLRRPDRARPGRGLRRAQGNRPCRGRALARAQPRLHTCRRGSRRRQIGDGSGWGILGGRGRREAFAVFRNADDAEKRHRPGRGRQRQRPCGLPAGRARAGDALPAAGRRRRSWWRRVAVVFVWLLVLALLVGLGTAGGAYLYYHQSVAAVAAQTKDVKVAAEAPRHPVAGPAGDRPRDRLRQALRRSRVRSDGPLRHADAAPRRPDRRLDLDALVPARPARRDRAVGNRVRTSTGSTPPTRAAAHSGALETVKHLTGLPINYLITVNFRGFRQLVDRVGGVWVDVDRRYFNDNIGTAATNYADIDLQPGYQAERRARARVRPLPAHRLRPLPDRAPAAVRQGAQAAGREQLLGRQDAEVVGAITQNVEVGQAAGSGSLGKTIKRTRSSPTTCRPGTSSRRRSRGSRTTTPRATSSSRPSRRSRTPCREFAKPDVEAPEKAATRWRSAARPFGRKAPPPSRRRDQRPERQRRRRLGGERGLRARPARLQIVLPPDASRRNAPTFDYFHTKVYFDRSAAGVGAAAREGRRRSSADADVERAAGELRATLADGAMVTVVVGQTFHGHARAGARRQDAEEAAAGGTRRPGADAVAAERVRAARAFRLMVPTVVEQLLEPRPRGADPRLLDRRRASAAVRLTFLDGQRARGLLGDRADGLERRAGARSSRTSST